MAMAALIGLGRLLSAKVTCIAVAMRAFCSGAVAPSTRTVAAAGLTIRTKSLPEGSASHCPPEMLQALARGRPGKHDGHPRPAALIEVAQFQRQIAHLRGS